MTHRWDAALRSLARRKGGALRELAYGVTAAPDEEAGLAAELRRLAPEVVAEVADPFRSATHRPLFRSRVLPWIKSPAPVSDPASDPRRRLDEVASDLAGFLDRLDQGELRLLPKPPRPAAQPRPLAVLHLRRFEDLGSDAEGIAGALEAVVLRGAHVRIEAEGLDTRTPEGRAMAAVALRLGGIKAVRARERSLEELTRRRDELRVYGPVPFGFSRRGQGLVPVPEEMASVARVRELAARGIPAFETALALNHERRTWKDGSPWTGKRVRQILLNPLYERHLRGTSA